jgi:hypothetical protein
MRATLEFQECCASLLGTGRAEHYKYELQMVLKLKHFLSVSFE